MRFRAAAAAILIALLTATLGPFAVPVQSENPQLSVRVRLFSDGWADVELSVNLTKAEAFTVVPLMGDPEALLAVDEDMSPLNYSLEDGSILIATMGSQRVTVFYQTPSLTAKSGGVWNVTVSPNVASWIVITLPNGSTVVGLSDVPERVESEGGRITLAFVSDSAWVSYVIPPPVESGRGTAGSGPGATEGAVQRASWWVPAAGLAAAAGVGAAIALSTRNRRRPSPAGEMDSTDAAILEGLARMGGEAYQADLIKSLGLPRSTVWRRIRRLAKEGHVELRDGERGKIVRLRRAE
ncbi:MAG: MarR family transcriptional regulator [Candidatus Korarchaeota archaeon]|nr:MarR family transcriptional regulator [Candidatus Korarchaeota archaeon]